MQLPTQYGEAQGPRLAPIGRCSRRTTRIRVSKQCVPGQGRHFVSNHSPMDKLKLIAFDAEDLAVVSAHVQDAVLKVGDLAYMPRERRFAAVLRRFDWTAVNNGKVREHLRRQSGLRFERVLSAKHQGIDLSKPGEVLALLAVQFVPHAPDDPAGIVELTFAGGAMIRLEVECLEAELRDLGPAWRAKSRPQHPDEDSGTKGS